jgi:hypothetical protein
MKIDITQVLKAWPYNPQHKIRIVKAQDDRKVIQLRLPLGIEQYELDGRPDGARPYGSGSALEEFEHRAREYADTHLCGDGFTISHEEYLELRGEAAQYYSRYLLLFQSGEFAKALRDALHNMRICSFVEKHVSSDRDQAVFSQYKPYIIWIYTISRLMLLLQAQDLRHAQLLLQEAIAEINNLASIDTPAFQHEKERSLRHLESALQQIDFRDEGSSSAQKDPEAEVANQTSSPYHYMEAGSIQRLQEELKKAIYEEDYEKAALIRDRLRERKP